LGLFGGYGIILRRPKNMKKLLVANWKSNPNTIKEAVKLARETDKRGVIICPPHIYLDAVGRTIRNAILGAQDVFWKNCGPYTGETSLSQLKNLKVKYIILGHSERREYLKETDKIINTKVGAALEAGFKVILCVGENLDVRKRGLGAAKKYIENQLKSDLYGIKRLQSNPIVIAYEPIWAIGTGKSDNPKETVSIIKHIKNYLLRKYNYKSPKVLYGGSVNIHNANNFLKEKEIDGALIGGASLRSKDFAKIVKYK
jgi:triosephosphate isomerase